MQRNVELAKRLREVLLNGKWIANTNLREQISNVTWQEALQQIKDLNTIALLSFHLNYYMEGILNVFRGGELEIKDQYSFDMEELLAEEDWKALINKFLDNAEQFVQAVERMDDHQLDQHFVDEKYGTYLRNIEGVIEHSYYHLGQIVLLRKMIQKQNVEIPKA